MIAAAGLSRADLDRLGDRAHPGRCGRRERGRVMRLRFWPFLRTGRASGFWWADYRIVTSSWRVDGYATRDEALSDLREFVDQAGVKP